MSAVYALQRYSGDLVFASNDPTVDDSVTGTLAATDGADSAAFVGIFLQNITGTLAAVDGADSAELSGSAAGSVTGTLNATDGADSAYIYYLATDAPDVSKLIDRDTLRLGSMPPVKRRGVTTYGTGRISKPRLG